MEPLREIRVRQVEGEPARRRFASADMELTAWFDSTGLLTGFQLCYDRTSVERAITWMRDQGFLHAAVDDGEGSAMRYKSSAMLVGDGEFDRERVREAFLAARGDLPAGIVGEVGNRLREYDPAMPFKTASRPAPG